MSQTRIWVDPRFKRMLKDLANKEDKSVLEFTRDVSENNDMMDKLNFKKRGKNGFFDIPF